MAGSLRLQLDGIFSPKSVAVIGASSVPQKFGYQIVELLKEGDTTWCKGRVSKKYIENNECLVDCEIWTENQLGQRTSKGLATILLPARQK